MDGMPLDTRLQWLQAMGALDVWQWTPAGPAPWFAVPQEDLLRMLVLGDTTATASAATLAADTAWWLRLRAIQQRVLEFFEREETKWKAARRVALGVRVDPQTNKLPSAQKVEDAYRADPDYDRVKSATEAARERLNHVDAVCSAMVAKKDALRFFYQHATH